MPVKKGPMTSQVLRSIQSVKFQSGQHWGRQLMVLYARQIDRAETIKQEVLETIKQLEDDGGTMNTKWFQRLERVERYMQAEATINKTGPLLLALMKEYGMTPGGPITQAKGNAGNSDGSQAVDQVEDELAALRAQRSGAAAGTA